MGLFTKKTDPILSKAKALENEIASLQSEIKKLQRKAERGEIDPPAPAPRAQTITAAPAVQHQRAISAREPIFESFEQATPASANGNGKNGKDPHFNELGVRKYDLGAAWKRMRTMISGPSTHNPKLVSYLAAGSIRGLRPLRYEKRIARNRFIALTIFFVVILWSALGLFFSHR